MTTPLTLPELLGTLAWGWGGTATATVTTLADHPEPRVRLVVTDPASELGAELMDIVLDAATRTVTGSIRWDMTWIVVDQIYDPIRADYVHGEPSISGWEMDITETGYGDAIACGYVLYGPRES